MKSILTMGLLGLALLLCADLLRAETPTQRRVRVALALSKTSSCSCGASCNCISGECGDPNCHSLTKTSKKSAIEWARYLVKYNIAISQKKPLLIWVGEACPPCEAKWTEFVHAHLSEYAGDKGTETGPEVIIAKPDGLGGMDISGRINGIPQKTQIDAILALPRGNPRDDPTWDNVNPYNTNPHWPYKSALPMVMPQSMMVMRPMIPMAMMRFGSFGGGGMGCGPGG